MINGEKTDLKRTCSGPIIGQLFSFTNSVHLFLNQLVCLPWDHSYYNLNFNRLAFIFPLSQQSSGTHPRPTWSNSYFLYVNVNTKARPLCPHMDAVISDPPPDLAQSTQQTQDVEAMLV